MNERDELMAQLRELRAQAEELTERTSQIIAEEERRRHRWTPIVIRGGMAGAAVAWLVGLVRGAHPIVAAGTTIGASGAIVGAVLTGPSTTPPQADNGRPPAIERSTPAPADLTRPPAVEPSAEPTVSTMPRPVLARPASTPPIEPSRVPRPSPASPKPPSPDDPVPPVTHDDCVVDLDALDIVDLCLAPTASRAAPPG